MHTNLLLALIFLLTWPSDKVRMIEYNGKPYRTTYDVEQFNGIYQGKKEGYLQLNADGTGVYVYDIFGLAPADCKKGPISLRYGFLIDKNDSLVRMERDYGYSYPVLLKSTGDNSFQGCRTEVLLDFLMVYKDGSIGVSSSDDWIRQD